MIAARWTVNPEGQGQYLHPVPNRRFVMNEVIGICSHCGGRVVLPSVWYGIYPPEPRCESCGATKKRSLPVIEMEPPRPTRISPHFPYMRSDGVDDVLAGGWRF